MSVNKVILIGVLGKDPEIRQTQSGNEIANLSIATKESWKDKATGEKKTKTEWHTVVIFQSGLVGIAKQFLKKGSKVYLEGSLQTRKWQDKTGADRYSTEIVLQGYNCSLTMLDSPQGRQQHKPDAHQESKQNGYQPEQSNDIDDDLPF